MAKQNNNKPSDTEGIPKKVMQLSIPGDDYYVPGSDVIGEFEELGEKDTGLVHGLNQQNVRAANQSNWAAVGNSFVQLVTGTVGDLVATPGYVYEGMGTITGGKDEMDNAFIQAGEYLSGLGEEYFPIYQSERSQQTIFNPFNGEWIANSVAQFGPTVAMLAATFATEGLAYPALAARLSKFGQIGKYIKAGEAWLQSGSRASNIVKSARMAGTSRMIEGGMESYETYKSTYADLIRKGHSEEEAKSLAGDAAAKVYTNNWMLAAVDMLQFKGILDGLGTIGKYSKLKKNIRDYSGQMASGAAEEGYQYAVAKEAENEIKYRLGEKGEDTTIMQEFLQGLGTTEMWQAMTQGALGGAVFTGVGKLASKMGEKYKRKVLQAQRLQKDSEVFELNQLQATHNYDVIDNAAKEGKLNLLKASYENAIKEGKLNEEEVANAQRAISYIDYYDQVANSITESDPAIKKAKIENLFRQKFSEQFIADVSQELTKYEGDINSQKKAAQERLKAAKRTKNDTLIKKYEAQVQELKEQDASKVTPTSNDAIIERATNLQVKAENSLLERQQEYKEFSKKEKRKEVKEKAAEAQKEELLEDVKADAQKITTPSNLISQREAYKNNPEALNMIDAIVNEKVKKELGNNKEPVTTDPNTILDFYKDKPLARYQKFKVKSQQELENKLHNKDKEKPAELQEEQGKAFAEAVERAKKEKEAKRKQKAAKKTSRKLEKKEEKQVEDIEETPAKLEKTPAVEETPTEEKLESAPLLGEKSVSDIVNESVENNKRAQDSIETNQIEQKEESNNFETQSNEEELRFSEQKKTDPSLAQVYDIALFKFQTLKVKGDLKHVIYYNHIKRDNKFDVIEVEEVLDNEGNYSHHKVITGVEGVTLPEKLRLNEYYPLKDENGYPIKSSYGNFIRDYDINVVKELYKYKDNEVFVEIDVTDGFNKNNNSDQIRIDYVIYPDGKRTVIGVMPAVKKGSSANFISLRQQIFNELTANDNKSNTPDNTFRYSKSTSVTHIMGGRFHTFYDKKNRNNPSSVINEGNPLIFGVGTNIPGNFDSYDIVLNLDSEARREEGLEPTNKEIREFTSDKPVRKGALTTGQVYVLVRNAANKLIPVRVFTKPVKAIVRLRNELLNNIRKFDADAASDIVKFNFVNKEGIKKSIPDFNNNLANIYSGVKVRLVNNKLEFGGVRTNPDGTKSISVQKDSNGLEYRKRGFTAGTILVDNVNNEIYQLTEKQNGKWRVQQLDSEFNPIGEVTSGEFLNTRLQTGDIELHYAYNYYRFYDMDNRPLQIDHTKVNIGNYNEVVADERLESDLVPKNNFASPKFQVQLDSLYKKEELKEKVVKKVEPTKKEVKKVEASKGVKVEQYIITEKDGKYYYANGEEVVDETTINKYLVKKDYDPSRKVKFANIEYYVLPDNRIISLGKTTKGKERYKTGKTREKILQKVNPVDSIEVAKKEYLAKKQKEAAKETSDSEVKETRKVNTPETTIEPKEERLSTRELRARRKKRNRPPKKFKLVNQGETREVWDKEEELAWLKENLPQVPTHVHTALTFLHKFGVNGYGLFHNGAIHLINSAQSGASYHEAFHAVFTMHLNEKETSKILKEADKRYNVTPREIQEMISLQAGLENTIDRATAKELVLEEKLADDFMNYVKARRADVKPSISSKIKRFFERLYNLLNELIGNKPTIDQMFWNINNGQYANAVFKRDVSSVIPKFKRHPMYPNPGEYKRIVDTVTSILDDSIASFRELNPETSTKKMVNKNLIFPKQNEISEEDIQDNLILSTTNPNSVYNRILDRMDELSADGKLDEATEAEFERFLASLMTLTEQEDGSLLIRPKLAAFDVLQNLSSRGIIINLDTSKLEEQEFGRAEIEPDNTEFVEEDNFRESWQILSTTISQLDKLSEKLRFEFNKIPVVKWKDTAKTEVEPVGGFLTFNRYYSLGHVYRQVQQVAGNSFSRLNMENKLREAARTKPMFKYLQDTYGNNDEFLGLLWIHVGQKNHPKFLTSLQDKEYGIVKSKVIPTNSVSKTNKIAENLVGGIVSNSPLFNSKGQIVQKQGAKLHSKLTKLKEDINQYYKDSGAKSLPEPLLEKLHSALESIGINIPYDILSEANEKNSKKYRKAITNKTTSFYSFVELIAQGKNPIEENNDGIKNFSKAISFAYPHDVQDAHKNPTGGQVYEWIDANYIGRTVAEFRNKEAALKKIEAMQQDEVYKNSPMLNLIKNGYADQPNEEDYFFNAMSMEFSIPSELKLANDSKGTEYSKMSERQLYINTLMLYYNSDHMGRQGKTYLPMPVHADSPTMTALQIPAIKNLTRDGQGKKGILNYLNDAAYQEYVRVKLSRNKRKNQNKYENKFVFFNELETKEFSSRKKELLKLDRTDSTDQKRIREILDEVVESQYRKAIREEVVKMEKLNIISFNSEENKYVWNDDLLNNTPIEKFVEHFVANFMLFQNQFATIFNGDLTYYKNVGDFYKRAKQVWSPGTYLDTTQTRVNFNVKVLNTNFIKMDDESSSYDAIYSALLALYDNEAIAKEKAEPFKKVDETDGQSYIDLFRYKEQQKGLHRWGPVKEKAYRRVLKGEYNIQDIEDLEIFNVQKPFYYGMHYDEKLKEVYPMQNKNSEFVIIPAFADPNNRFYNPKYKDMLQDMGYNEEGRVDNIEEFENKRGNTENNFTDQFVFDSAIKVGLSGNAETIEDSATHRFNNSDWRLQMETPVHHINDKVIFATQTRKHMLNDLELDAKEYRDPDTGKLITGREWLKKYNEVIIEDIKADYKRVAKKFSSFEELINTLREEVIKRDLGDQYLEALDYWTEQVEYEDGTVEEILHTKLPLWHPLHLYRIESMLNSLFTKGVTRQELTNGVTLANLSSYGFRRTPKMVFRKDGSLKYLEAYAPVYDQKLYDFIDSSGNFDRKGFDEKYGKGASEKALKGVVWRIPNEDKYSTFNIKIIGFLPQETGGAIVLPPEITKIAGLDKMSVQSWVN